jgi:hypothetical protein
MAAFLGICPPHKVLYCVIGIHLSTLSNPYKEDGTYGNRKRKYWNVSKAILKKNKRNV